MNTQSANIPNTGNTGRNDRCPCGSGKKFKHCCLGKSTNTRAGFSFNAGLLWKAPVVLILLTGLIVFAVDVAGGRGVGALNSRSALPAGPLSTQSAAFPPGTTPEPWFYDTANNQYWDPGHAHWHVGPPPPPESRSLDLPAGATPAPWFYDTVNNQHWHPTHAHWHTGPPPPPSQRR